MTTSTRRILAAIACGALVAVVICLVAGCASSAKTSAADPAGTMSGSTSSGMSGSSGSGATKGMVTAAAKKSVVASDGTQSCGECAGNGMAPMVEGKATDHDGTQFVVVGIKDGYYTPNVIAVKAGVPTKVFFEGKATGCLSKPQFKALGLKADFGPSDTAQIDLGKLKAGTYQWMCGMGMTGGKIVAQ